MARKTKKFQLSEEQQKLASENINLARREAWKLQKTTDIEYDILEGAALEGLCKAAYRYDPGSGYKFSSLAVPTIRGELLHWIRDRTYAMKLSHKMRERWIKGRLLLYKGMTDIEVAASLEIELVDWLEIKSICSGPPLELTEQAKSTESLEPQEIDFSESYYDEVERRWNMISDSEKTSIENYLAGSTGRIPYGAFESFLQKA